MEEYQVGKYGNGWDAGVVLLPVACKGVDHEKTGLFRTISARKRNLFSIWWQREAFFEQGATW